MLLDLTFTVILQNIRTHTLTRLPLLGLLLEPKKKGLDLGAWADTKITRATIIIASQALNFVQVKLGLDPANCKSSWTYY